MKDALHVPRIHGNLLLLSKMVLQGLKVQFNYKGCLLKVAGGEMIVIIPTQGTLYQIKFKTVNGSSMVYFA